MSCERENAEVRSGQVDSEYASENNSGRTLTNATNENTVIVQISVKSLIRRIAREIGIVDDAVEDKIQNVILAAVNNIITPMMEMAIGSMNASSGQDIASAVASS